MSDQILAEFIRTLGETFRDLSSRVEHLEQHGASKDDIRELKTLIKESHALIKKNYDSLLDEEVGVKAVVKEIKGKVVTNLETIVVWDKVWGKLFSFKFVLVYIMILLFAIFGGGVLAFKFPWIIQGLLNFL